MKFNFYEIDFFDLLIIPIYLIIIIFSYTIFFILYLLSLPSQFILTVVEREESKKNSLDIEKK